MHLVQVLRGEARQNHLRLGLDLLAEVLLGVLALLDFYFQQFLQTLNFVKHLRVTFFLSFALLCGLRCNGAFNLVVVVLELS